MGVIAYLGDGTPVRVMTTPLPVEPRDLNGKREGDVIVGYSVPRYMPWRFLKRRRRFYMVRRGADGQLWLVRLRRRP